MLAEMLLKRGSHTMPGRMVKIVGATHSQYITQSLTLSQYNTPTLAAKRVTVRLRNELKCPASHSSAVCMYYSRGVRNIRCSTYNECIRIFGRQCKCLCAHRGVNAPPLCRPLTDDLFPIDWARRNRWSWARRLACRPGRMPAMHTLLAYQRTVYRVV